MLLHVVDRTQLRMRHEELLEAMPLSGVEPVGALAQEAKPSPVPAKLGTELAGNPHQMQSGDADGVEAVGDDEGPRKPASDQRSVRRRQVDTDDADLIATAQPRKEGPQFGLAAAGGHVEDPPTLKVAEGRGKALAAVERVLVYP